MPLINRIEMQTLTHVLFCDSSVSSPAQKQVFIYSQTWILYARAI